MASASIPRLRPLWFALTVVLLGIAAWEFALLVRIVGDQQAIGVDLDYYRFVAQRWLDTGVYYTDRQLSGPYTTMTLVDNLYPPHALFLFVPFTVLPAPLWWIVPAIIVAYVVYRLRPRAWAITLIALILALPKTGVAIIYGNSDLWVVALVAGGVLWAWPAVFITFKPSLGFFALVGIRRRAWWIGAFALAVVSLPMLPLWLDWPVVIRNSTVTAEYSLATIPFMLIPLVAWLGGTNRRTLSIPSWLPRRRGSGALPTP